MKYTLVKLVNSKNSRSFSKTPKNNLLKNLCIKNRVIFAWRHNKDEKAKKLIPQSPTIAAFMHLNNQHSIKNTMKKK